MAKSIWLVTRARTPFGAPEPFRFHGDVMTLWTGDRLRYCRAVERDASKFNNGRHPLAR